MTTHENLMRDKVCMVTGATSGIGLATAEALARMGATLVVVGRNREKGGAAVARIQEASGDHSVEYLHADLSVQTQVRNMAQEFKGRYPRLDVLVNNAGAFFLKRQLTADGIEMTWAVNHLSAFLLTNLLLEPLEASAAGRVVNVSSNRHLNGTINFDDLEGARRYGGFAAYDQSKLADVLFTYELARRLGSAPVTVNALHPGSVATNIAAGSSRLAKFFMPLGRLVALSPEAGADTSVFLASSPEVAGVTGKYFVKQRAVRSSPTSYDEARAQRLWRISAEMTGLSA